MLAGVAATGEVAITRSLVTIGRRLLTIGRSLVTIGRCLVTVRRSLIALGGCLVVGVRERLVVLQRPRRNDNALLPFVAHPVPGIDVPIT